MDDVASYIEKFGTVSISAPVVAAPGDVFKFNLSPSVGGADNYYKDAKTGVQGQSSVYDKTSQGFSFGASAQLDPTQIAAFAATQAQFELQQRQYLEYLKKNPPTSAPTAPTPPTAKTDNTDVPAAPTDLAPALTTPSFADFRSLLPATQPVLSDRDAIKIAAGDRATEAIFTVLGDPTLAGQFKDKLVVFGVSMVSVNPGWHTRHGYQADLGVLTQYAYVTARYEILKRFIADDSVPMALRKRVAMDNGIPPPGGPVGALNRDDPIPARFEPAQENDRFTPLVAAVSPMTETQSLDLTSGQRRQTELALKLSFALRYAGLGGQAQAFERFVASREQDTRTLTPTTTVNAFSSAGGLFGFEIGPRLRAIEDPARKGSRDPANVLDRQSFPILILFGLDREDTRPRVKRERGAFVLVEPKIQLTTYTNWIPLNGGSQRFGERELLQLGYNLRSATNNPNPSVLGGADDQFNQADLDLFDQIASGTFQPSTNGGQQLQSLRGKLTSAGSASRGSSGLGALLDLTKPDKPTPPDPSRFEERLSDLIAGQNAVVAANASFDRSQVDDQLAIVEQDRGDQLKAAKSRLDTINTDSATNVTKAEAEAKKAIGDATTAKTTFERARDEKEVRRGEAEKILDQLLDQWFDLVAIADLIGKLDAANNALVDAIKTMNDKQSALQAAETRAKDAVSTQRNVRIAEAKARHDAAEDYVTEVGRINKSADTFATSVVRHSHAPQELDDARKRFDEAMKQAAVEASSTLRGWIKEAVVSPESNDAALNTVVGFAQGRSNMLRYRCFGGGLAQYIPYDNVIAASAAPAATPSVSAVSPTSVTLMRSSTGEVIPQVVNVVVFGSNLKSVDLSADAFAASRVKGDAKLVLDNGKPSVKLQGDALVIAVQVTGPSGFGFDLPIKGSKDSLFTPPVQVSLAASSLRFERLHLPFFDRFDFSQVAPPDVVKSEIERNKRVPAGPTAPVNVQIQSAQPQTPAKP